MSVLYEKGSPSWDIGMILTRHAAGLPEHRGHVCAIVADLRATVGQPAAQRLARAVEVTCDCHQHEQPRLTSVLPGPPPVTDEELRAELEDPLL